MPLRPPSGGLALKSRVPASVRAANRAVAVYSYRGHFAWVQRYEMLKTKVVAGVLFFAAFAFGQFDTSEVLGTVHDPSQKPVAKATVTLTNQDTGIEAKTTTDQSGDYDFFNVK